jgi:hypothetical protein
MRQAIWVVLTLAFLTACSPTAAQEDDGADWPTPLELRDTMSAARGWLWGATPVDSLNAMLDRSWEGGPAAQERWFPVTVSGEPGSLRVEVDIWLGDLSEEWPESVDSSWTAWAEIAERLPVDADTKAHIRADAAQGRFLDGCMDHRFRGGHAMVEYRLYAHHVTVEQGARTTCPPDSEPVTPVPATPEPAWMAVQSVAPELEADVESMAAAVEDEVELMAGAMEDAVESLPPGD